MIPRIDQCRSPIRPTRYNLVVAVDIIGSKTAGGIIIPEKTREREDSASDKGRVVAISPMAFKGGDWADSGSAAADVRTAATRNGARARQEFVIAAILYESAIGVQAPRSGLPAPRQAQGPPVCCP